MTPITAHGQFRALRTFFSWCVETRLVVKSPMHGLTMKKPKILPRVPEDEHVRKLLATCPSAGFEGHRNMALIALLVDSGLRITEALHLRIEDVRFSERTLSVHGGKGQKDGVGFLGAEAAKTLRDWFQGVPRRAAGRLCVHGPVFAYAKPRGAGRALPGESAATQT